MDAGYLNRQRVRLRPEAPARTKLNISEGQLWYGNQCFRVKELGKGNSHKVYGFEGTGTFSIDGADLDISKIVLKVYSVHLSGKQKEREMKREMAAYDRLAEMGVPVSIAYARPPNNDFWVMERMVTKFDGNWSTPLTETEKKVLLFAKGILEENYNRIKEGKETYVDDPHIGNIMLDAQGQPKVVDFSRSETEEEHNLEQLNSAINLWSNGNKEVLDLLTEKIKLLHPLPSISDAP